MRVEAIAAVFGNDVKWQGKAAAEGGITPSRRVSTDVINVKHHAPYYGHSDVNVKDPNSTRNSGVFLCTAVVHVYITLKLHNVTTCIHSRTIYNASHATNK